MLSRLLRTYRSWHLVSFTVAGTALLTFICALLVYFVEGPDPASPINTFFDGLYWAMGTVTRVGYGDIVPISVVGKISAATLAIAGFFSTAVFMGWVVAKSALR